MKSVLLYTKLSVFIVMLLAIAATVAFPAKIILVGNGRLPCTIAEEQDERPTSQSTPRVPPWMEEAQSSASVDPSLPPWMKDAQSSASVDPMFDVVPIDKSGTQTSTSRSQRSELSRADRLCVVDTGVQIFRVVAIFAAGGVVLWGLNELEKGLLRHT